jgi:hypothetical protein
MVVIGDSRKPFFISPFSSRKIMRGAAQLIIIILRKPSSPVFSSVVSVNSDNTQKALASSARGWNLYYTVAATLGSN